MMEIVPRPEGIFLDSLSEARTLGTIILTVTRYWQHDHLNVLWPIHSTMTVGLKHRIAWKELSKMD